MANKNPLHKMETPEIIELLKTQIQEEQNLRTTIRSTMNIYITLLVAILGGIVTLVASTYGTIDRVVLGTILILSGTVVFFIALAALKHFRSDYLRQSEAIVQEAKLEDILGMSNPNAYPLREYWKGETLLPQSFLESRSMFEHSQDFVDWLTKTTDLRIARIVYSVFMGVGCVISVFGILNILFQI